jgi:hypothetical protein
MPDDRDFLDSVVAQARRFGPANDNPSPMPVPVAITLALLLAVGAIGLIVTFLKIAGLF